MDMKKIGDLRIVPRQCTWFKKLDGFSATACDHEFLMFEKFKYCPFCGGEIKVISCDDIKEVTHE